MINRLPIKQGFYSPTDNIVLYYSGKYHIIDRIYLLFFIANKEGTIYDTFLAPPSAIAWESDKIIVKSDIEEVFIKRE